jgi:hypothetical protein
LAIAPTILVNCTNLKIVQSQIILHARNILKINDITLELFLSFRGTMGMRIYVDLAYIPFLR